MSKFTVGDLCMLIVNSCYRSSAKRSEDTAKKLEIQSRMHASKIRFLEEHVRDLSSQKETYIQQKNVSQAKKKIIEIHKVNLRKNRCEQLKDCCDRYLESINEFGIVQDTVGALNEAKTTFKHIGIERIGMKVGEISDVVSDFRTELENTQSAIGNMDSGGNEISDEELKAELDSLDEMFKMEHKPSLSTPDNIDNRSSSSVSVSRRYETSGSEKVNNVYKSTGIFELPV